MKSWFHWRSWLFSWVDISKLADECHVRWGSTAAVILRGPSVAFVWPSERTSSMQYSETALKYFTRRRRHFQLRVQLLTRSCQYRDSLFWVGALGGTPRLQATEVSVIRPCGKIVWTLFWSTCLFLLECLQAEAHVTQAEYQNYVPGRCSICDFRITSKDSQYSGKVKKKNTPTTGIQLTL
jgi:hypothetical protein